MEIKFWENKSNRAPVFEFIESQEANNKQRIMKSVDHFAQQGMNLLFSPSKMKALSGYRNLYELRIDFKGMFYRIIKGVAYLLTAFKKKANNTPSRHIKTALIRQQSLA